jgi:hypothetical protein
MCRVLEQQNTGDRTMNRSPFVRFRILFGAFALAAIGAAAVAGEPPGLKFSKRCLMVNLNEGCAVADVNRDGRTDVIAGTHWYAAPDFIPRPLREIPETGGGEYAASNGDHAYDVNGDGWVDVISIGFFEPELCWFENPGELGLKRTKLWKRHVLQTTRGQNEAIDLRDLDGDGVPEIVVNCWDKKAPLVAWKLAKAADGKPTAEKKVLGAEGCGHGYGFGDVNGDGREDILCEVGWFERPAGDVFQPWKHHPQPALPHASCPFLVADLNGDGRNDLIWGKGHDYGLFWWEQGPPKPDGTLTWTEHVIDKSWSQPHCLVWADLDGDGKPELIAGKRYRAHGDGDPGGKEPECLYYYTWDKSAGQFTRHTISPPGGGVGCGMQLRVADLNGDGRPDIVAPGKSGTWLLLNEGPAK